MKHDLSCGVCRNSLVRLPVLGPPSVLSDGRVVPSPLAKAACPKCGMVRHKSSPSEAQVAALYSEDYGLYAHAPGDTFERRRQAAYADWIIAFAKLSSSDRVFEIGAGNGSLLLALKDSLSELQVAGVEPANAAASHARQMGTQIETEFFNAGSCGDFEPSLVLAVNVIEHVPDTGAFLSAIRESLDSEGRALIICPRGDRTSTEILFFDHLYTFTVEAMSAIAARAGLRLLHTEAGQDGLSDFQAYLFAPGEVSPEEAPSDDFSATVEAHQRFLRTWSRLDEALCRRLEGFGSVVGFGVGEAATLVRAYAPRTWVRLSALTADAVNGSVFGLEAIEYRKIDDGRFDAVLLLTSLSSQEGLSTRLEAEGWVVIGWADLFASKK